MTTTASPVLGGSVRCGADPIPEIDGLRAIAVIPVMLFHLNIKGVGGGFVGVDVFFVISGFLISRIIFGGIDAGTFSIAGFYERRIRRIAPALTVCTAITAVTYLFLYSEEEMLALRSQFISAVRSFSNIYFYLLRAIFQREGYAVLAHVVAGC